MDLIAAEGSLRLGSFVVVLAVAALAEAWAPRRRRTLPRRTRWPSNLAIVGIGTLLVRLVLPATTIGIAAIAEERAWGLLNAVSLPTWARIALAVGLLDLAIYLQHVLFHTVPLLWRLHRVHHADLDVDATTGARFHPVEILLSMGVKLGVVVALGAPPLAVLLFEVLLSASSTFNHANLGLWPAVDRALRWLVVTPDMHRVHHSIVGSETNRNFGFTLPWWDRLGGTYQAQPAGGHDAMIVGIELFRDPRCARIDQLLLQPCRQPCRQPDQQPAR